jgi:Zn-dependent peptidase ImmA (M78 family)/transcriptional regulator with XRE-family HTH domain
MVRVIDLLHSSPHAADVSRLFDPARLRQARRLTMMTKQALAGKVGVSPASVGQYESGVHSPGPQVLRALADALDVPLEFFAPDRPLTSLDSSDAHFRSLRSTTVGQRNKALAFTEQVWELTHALERWVEFPPVHLPDVDTRSGTDSSRADLRVSAEALRNSWNVRLDEPFPHLTRTAETNGIVVVFAAFAGEGEKQRIDAFSTSKLSRPIIVTPPDRAEGVYKHRFNLAHELGHLLLHRDEVHGELAIEREANAFAGELLMPERVMRNLLKPRVDWDVLGKLSHRWGVEMKALVYRSRELGILSDAAARRAYQRLEVMRGAGLISNFATTEFEGEIPVLLQRAFEFAQSEGVTTASLAAQLHWRPSTVTALLGGTGDNRPKLRALL